MYFLPVQTYLFNWSDSIKALPFMSGAIEFRDACHGSQLAGSGMGEFPNSIFIWNNGPDAASHIVCQIHHKTGEMISYWSPGISFPARTEGFCFDNTSSNNLFIVGEQDIDSAGNRYYRYVELWAAPFYYFKTG